MPNSRVSERWKDYRDRDAKIVSCNTHCVTTALAMLSNMFSSPEELRGKVRNRAAEAADAVDRRREDDEGRVSRVECVRDRGRVKGSIRDRGPARGT